MLTKMKTVALSAMIALGAFAAAPAAAQAGDLRVGIHIGGGYGPGWGYGPRWDAPRAHCRPARALNKASRMGLRRAYVHRAGYNGVVVKGKRAGRTHTVVFGKAPNCPVRNWR